MYQDATKTYQQANFFTATPIKLVMMCYDGAIGSLK
jgi:flagellin-specific chaperone FliS